jgi:hypothetical protein
MPTTTYGPSDADRPPLPASYQNEPRYLGYRDACRTDMPGVTAAMWDWWFGWLGGDSSRYKLWCPDAHQFIAVGDDRIGDRSLTDRQRYVGNVSYADEYLGGILHRLTIRFVDPARLGFDESPDTTYIFARVGFSHLPLLFGWLIHQIRPTNDGAEMRTRFFLNYPQIIDVPARSLPSSALARSLTRRSARQFANAALPRIGRRLLPHNIGHDLLYHCASEMNHLAASWRGHNACCDVNTSDVQRGKRPKTQVAHHKPHQYQRKGRRSGPSQVLPAAHPSPDHAAVGPRPESPQQQ